MDSRSGKAIFFYLNSTTKQAFSIPRALCFSLWTCSTHSHTGHQHAICLPQWHFANKPILVPELQKINKDASSTVLLTGVLAFLIGATLSHPTCKHRFITVTERKNGPQMRQFFSVFSLQKIVGTDAIQDLAGLLFSLSKFVLEKAAIRKQIYIQKRLWESYKQTFSNTCTQIQQPRRKENDFDSSKQWHQLSAPSPYMAEIMHFESLSTTNLQPLANGRQANNKTAGHQPASHSQMPEHLGCLPCPVLKLQF